MNVHDFAGMQRLAGAMHEAGHAVVGMKRGQTLTRLTRHETRFSNPHDAVTAFAGAHAVRRFDPKGRHSVEDDGDRANVAKLGLSADDIARASDESAKLVAEHWQSICNVALALHRSPNGELTPEAVKELVT